MVSDPHLKVEILSRPLNYVKIKNSVYIEHSHLQHEMMYVISGELWLCINGELYKMQERDILFIPNKHIHSMYTPSESLILGVSFMPEELPQFQRLVEQVTNRPILIKQDSQPDTLRLLYSRFASATHLAEDSLTLASSIDQLLGFVKSKLVDLNDEPIAEASLSTATFERVLRAICNRIPSKITLDMVAEEAGVSKFHISRQFKNHLGIGFSTYTTILRVYGAMRLLEQTQLKIAEIAANCGFETIRSFNRSFKELVGCTPIEFREKYKNDPILELPIPRVKEHLQRSLKNFL